MRHQCINVSHTYFPEILLAENILGLYLKISKPRFYYFIQTLIGDWSRRRVIIVLIGQGV